MTKKASSHKPKDTANPMRDFSLNRTFTFFEAGLVLRDVATSENHAGFCFCYRISFQEKLLPVV